MVYDQHNNVIYSEVAFTEVNNLIGVKKIILSKMSYSQDQVASAQIQLWLDSCLNLLLTAINNINAFTCLPKS